MKAKTHRAGGRKSKVESRKSPAFDLRPSTLDPFRGGLGLLEALVIIAILAILGPLVWAKWQVHQQKAEEQGRSWLAPAASFQLTGTLYPYPDGKGRKVFISEGPVPVGEFLQFLSDYTGLSLLYDLSQPRTAPQEITIFADIREADDEVVKAILVINRIRVFHEVLPGGKELLKVESIQPTGPDREDPIQSRIIAAGGQNADHRLPTG